ncbi:MAG: LytTR family DNA-binding domain-containing protein [Pseudomonadota bacterium]
MVGRDNTDIVRVACIVSGFALVLATTIFFRSSFRVTPDYSDVAIWQLLVWMPWTGVFYVVSRLGITHPVSGWWAVKHMLAAGLIASAMVVWSWFVSGQFSPYVGVVGTKHGAFAYFFIYWFFINVLIYWLVIAYMMVMESLNQIHVTEQKVANLERTLRGTSPKIETPTDSDVFFSALKGGRRHIVWARDILWIEAQGYYAELHLAGESFLIRQSLRTLAEELDPHTFIRIHRSTIVRITHIRSIDSDTVTLADGKVRRLSRSGRALLNAVLNRNK